MRRAVLTSLASFALVVGSLTTIAAAPALAITPTAVPNPLAKPTVVAKDASATVSWTQQYGSVAVGTKFACYNDATGSVRCWGANDQGQLGDGDTTSIDSPMQVTGLTSGVAAIAAGDSHACALTGTGSVLCWGAGASGQLGDGKGTSSSTPVAVSGLPSNITAISAGANDSCAVTATGALYCWGDNTHGQLGDGTTSAALSAKAVFAAAGTIVSSSSSNTDLCVVTSTGDAWCAGSNATGQLGLSRTDTSDHKTPVQVTLTLPLNTISTSDFATCGVAQNRHLECWGGTTGYDTSFGTGAPPNGPFMNNAWSLPATGVQLFNGGGCTLTNLQQIYCWGDNTHDQTGQFGYTQVPTPQFVSAGVTAWAIGSASGCDVEGISGITCWGQLYPSDTNRFTRHDLASTDAISGYVATAHPDGQSCATNRDGSSCTITGLSNGQIYTFTVRATNVVGDGPESPATDPTPIGQATPPDIDPNSIVTGAGFLTVGWTSPDSKFGNFQSSTVQWRVHATATWTSIVVPAPLVTTTIDVPDGAQIDVRVSVTCNGIASDFSTIQSYLTDQFAVNAGATSTVIRPARDGFQDSATLVVSTNGDSDGVLNVLDAKNHVVRHWALETGTRWTRSWNGANDAGKRLPYGTYRTVAAMNFQGKTHTSTPHAVKVSVSQVDTPTVSLEASTVYPYKDYYLDTLNFTIEASLPATGTEQVVKGGKVIWSYKLPRSQTWTSGWNGRTSRGATAPAGSYTLVVTLKGLEGTTKTTTRKFKVSAQRLVPSAFSTSSSASVAYRAAAQGAPAVNDAASAVVLHSDPNTGNFDIAWFALPMPTSLQSPSKGHLQICISAVQGNTAAVGVLFTTSSARPVSAVYALDAATGCFTFTGTIPGAAYSKNRLYFAIANADDVGVSSVTVKSFSLSGKRYTLK